MTNIFLSHKKDFAAQAQVLALALHKITPGAAIFRSEDIEKGQDRREAVNRALGEAKCFILRAREEETHQNNRGLERQP